MKIRTGFVSNSSSSSFVVFKDALSKKEQDMILDYQTWVEFFLNLDIKNNNIDDLINKFSYYDSDPWRIEEHADFIFGETTMDNFSMSDYFEYIKISQDYIGWDDGYNIDPTPDQENFIKNMKQKYIKKYRKQKINKINDNEI